MPRRAGRVRRRRPYLTGPPEEFVPAHLHGSSSLGALVSYAGGEEGRAIDRADPRARARGRDDRRDAVRRTAEHDRRPARLPQLVDRGVPGRDPRRGAGPFCATGADRRPSPAQHLHLPWGGAVASGEERLRSRSATRPGWCTRSACGRTPPTTSADCWARGFRDDMRASRAGGTYLNFIADEGEERVARATARRSTSGSRIKARYDPDNVFHLHHPIAPLQPA